jgi:transmembrane sensor
MDNQEAKNILERYRNGLCTEEEKAWVESWYLKTELGSGDISHEEIESAMAQVQDNLPGFDEKRRILWPRIAAAASIIMILGLGGYFFVKKKEQPSPVAVNRVKNDVLPGGNKAYLTLGNGQRVSLTDAKNGMIANQAGKNIQKTAEGMIVYDNTHNSHNTMEVIYNTIETPRGGQYQIVLPDGSKVWLNAASSLKYPAEFTGTDRLVELTGEAYFEVAKDKAHPFKVKTAKQEVEVLGTHFDVNSYADEAHVATTLLEGSVKVTSSNKKQIVIKPGEQAVNDGQLISIQQADADNVIDWKDGDFFLNHVPFKVAMRKIARWYDVEVVYETNIPDQIESGGWIKRSRELSKVLGAIQRSGQVQFKIEGRKIYVSK